MVKLHVMNDNVNKHIVKLQVMNDNVNKHIVNTWGNSRFGPTSIVTPAVFLVKYSKMAPPAGSGI